MTSRDRRRIYTGRDATRALGVAAVVGTVLVLLNQGPGAYFRMWSDIRLAAQVLANYLIPFAVASTGAALANRAR